jgi:hypothetical protein
MRVSLFPSGLSRQGLVGKLGRGIPTRSGQGCALQRRNLLSLGALFVSKVRLVRNPGQWASHGRGRMSAKWNY